MAAVLLLYHASFFHYFTAPASLKARITGELILRKCVTLHFCRCELCGKTFNDYTWIFRDQSKKHRKQCLRENRTEYDSIPDSSLYKCKNCHKDLKVWPVDKLEGTKCTKCDVDVTNDGTNIHVCFTCGGERHKTDRNHSKEAKSQATAKSLVPKH